METHKHTANCRQSLTPVSRTRSPEASKQPQTLHYLCADAALLGAKHVPSRLENHANSTRHQVSLSSRFPFLYSRTTTLHPPLTSTPQLRSSRSAWPITDRTTSSLYPRRPPHPSDPQNPPQHLVSSILSLLSNSRSQEHHKRKQRTFPTGSRDSSSSSGSECFNAPRTHLHHQPQTSTVSPSLIAWSHSQHLGKFGCCRCCEPSKARKG